MLGIHDYPLFMASAVLLNVTPGPDTLYILARSVGGGRRSGLVSVLGIASGLLLHTIAVAAGLSAVLAASATAFQAVKFAGAFYLVFLGVKSLLIREPLAVPQATKRYTSKWAVYRQGVLTNALNPKVALFFLALLPQFVDKTAANHGFSLFLLGTSFLASCTVWGLLVAMCASSFSASLRRHSALSRGFQGATGVLFIGLGVKLALAKQTN